MQNIVVTGANGKIGQVIHLAEHGIYGIVSVVFLCCGNAGVWYPSLPQANLSFWQHLCRQGHTLLGACEGLLHYITGTGLTHAPLVVAGVMKNMEGIGSSILEVLSC